VQLQLIARVHTERGLASDNDEGADAAGSLAHQHCDADSEEQPLHQAPRLSNMDDSPEMPHTINSLATFLGHKMDSQYNDLRSQMFGLTQGFRDYVHLCAGPATAGGNARVAAGCPRERHGKCEGELQHSWRAQLALPRLMWMPSSRPPRPPNLVKLRRCASWERAAQLVHAPARLPGCDVTSAPRMEDGRHAQGRQKPG